MFSISCSSRFKLWRNKKKNPRRTTKIKPFINKYNWEGMPFINKYNWEKINFQWEKVDWKKFEKNNVTNSLNVLYAKK